jgi:VIT1/CCC1 family predicted Fe2+/Mn2+ transporter
MPKVNVLFVVSLILFIVPLINYIKGLAMIELWQISIALLAVSFGAWFEIHTKYGDAVKEKKKTRLKKVRYEINNICEMLHEGKGEEEIDKKLAHLTTLYEESNEPINLFETTWNAFSIAGLFFLIAVFCRLGADLLTLSQLLAVEAFTFLIGIFFFILAIVNTRNLMNLLSSDKDPVASLLRTTVIAIVQALHSYVIWELSLNLASVLSSRELTIFYILLWCTFGGAILLWVGTEKKDKKLSIGGFFIIYSPWFWLAILGVLITLGLI